MRLNFLLAKGQNSPLRPTCYRRTRRRISACDAKLPKRRSVWAEGQEIIIIMLKHSKARLPGWVQIEFDPVL